MSATRRTDAFTLACHVAGGLVLLFILAPLASLVLACPPTALAQAAGELEVRASIWLTLWTAAGATLLVALPAIPFAWWLARRRFPGKGLVTGIINLPLAIPHPVAGIALLAVLSRGTWAGQAADACGLAFIGTPAGIMAAMAFVSLPIFIASAHDAFAQVPERLEKAALTLGASPLRMFLSISLPLAWRGLLTGAVLMFSRGISEFGAIVIIAYHPMVAPVFIYERFSTFGLAHARGPIVLFLAVCLAVFVALRLLAGRRDAAL